MLANLKNIDAVYWQNLKNGDTEALGFLYDKYVDKLFIKAYKLTNNRELAKDAVQEVFLELWRYRSSITEIQYSQSYLSKVLLSVTLKKQKKEKSISYGQLEDSFISDELNIESIIISRDLENEKEKKLQTAISMLSQRQKQILKLHFTDGLSYEQISEMLGINYQSVNNLAFRTIHQLRNLMYLLILFIFL
ncbi:RNA polymerase sigma factor [Flavihumibacter profundi]|jgi:RNA polymerase sigma factor (sigma-70 family)|uniref:RNA polymerase sigma factor n=1 Tax=Flavihumibacter profundi TaxID=2716883 RepID=UPI001CC7330C|nr:RNA polymerase sigma factor [Flavihumibacter profundi]MBZ5856008.1 RNA polymerase sigma factor [Flavihumibacter profundi]